MSKLLTDDNGLIHAFNALYDLATPRQRELFRQDEVKPVKLPGFMRPGGHIPFKTVNGQDYVELRWLENQIKDARADTEVIDLVATDKEVK